MAFVSEIQPVRLERAGSKRELVIPPEGQLREQMLNRLHGLSTKKQGKIIRMFQKYRPLILAEMVMPYFEHAIRQAMRSHQWEGTGGPDSRVGIGYYRTEAEYFSTFLHEAGHNVLSSLGRSNDEYLLNAESEEDFCWRFSQYMCALLSLPFSRDREQIDRSFFLFKKKLNGDSLLPESEVLYQQLIEREMTCLGFSSLGGDTFQWSTDGVPEKCPATLVR